MRPSGLFTTETTTAPEITSGSTPESLRALAEIAPDCLLVDPWNALGTSQVFAYVAEVAALRA